MEALAVVDVTRGAIGPATILPVHSRVQTGVLLLLVAPMAMVWLLTLRLRSTHPNIVQIG